jgi:hypothetical protein
LLELCSLLDPRSALSDIKEHYSHKDSGTGLFNKKGFSEAAQRGKSGAFTGTSNIFSVMLVEISLGRRRRATNR